MKKVDKYNQNIGYYKTKEVHNFQCKKRGQNPDRDFTKIIH